MEWQPIDTAPKDDEMTFLLLGHGGTMQPCWYSLEHGKWFTTWRGIEGNGFTNPTHWMPMPDPPAI